MKYFRVMLTVIICFLRRSLSCCGCRKKTLHNKIEYITFKKGVLMKEKILHFLLFCLASLPLFFSAESVRAQYSFVHITDLHVSDAVSYVNSCDNHAVTFQCYIQEFANLNPKPAFVVVSGDVANIGNNGPSGMYPELTQYLYPPSQSYPANGSYFIDSAQTIPIYFVGGNHEYYTTLIPPLSNATPQYYPHYIGPDSDYVVNTQYAAIIFLRSGYDDDRPIWEDINITSPEGHGLSMTQCAWLRHSLSINANKRKIIVMHHPPVNAIGTNSDGSPDTGTVVDGADGSILNNRQTFLNICDSNHVDIVLSGHEHKNVVAIRAGNAVNENWTGETRYVQTAAAFNRSYRIITVDSLFVTVGAPLQSCMPAAIEEMADVATLTIYPNPTKDNITIESALHSRIEIINIEGQILKTLQLTDHATQMDVSNLPNGVYILKAYSDKGVSIQKLIRQ